MPFDPAAGQCRVQLHEREVADETAIETPEAFERDHPDRPRADASDAREPGDDRVSGEAAEALEVERRREAGEDRCPLLGEAEPA